MLDQNRLPLVEFVKTLHPSICLKKTCVIAVQHLLETTHLMFRSWIDLGLEPTNLYVLGKCYSTNLDVARKMQQEGIQISPLSDKFNSHLSYDEQFTNYISLFLENILAKELLDRFEKIIILDDGGHLITAIQKLPLPFNKVVAIEQTSSGYEMIKELKLHFPVINVARARVKLEYECPMVADVIAQHIDRFNMHSKKLLIIGKGAIGCALETVLKNRYEVTTYDKLGAQACLEEVLPNADIILGCTGTVSIPYDQHAFLKKNCVLISASSSDREFDSVHIRKSLPLYDKCHQHLHNGSFQLLNSGFPINFNGAKHSVNPEKIQLVRALLTLALFQAFNLNEDKGLVDLDPYHQTAIANTYRSLVKEDSS